MFAGMVRAVDDSVGNIVKALSDSGLLENTVLVFMSDNGAPSVETRWDTENRGSNWPLRGVYLYIYYTLIVNLIHYVQQSTSYICLYSVKTVLYLLYL